MALSRMRKKFFSEVILFLAEVVFYLDCFHKLLNLPHIKHENFPRYRGIPGKWFLVEKNISVIIVNSLEKLGGGGGGRGGGGGGGGGGLKTGWNRKPQTFRNKH